MEHNVETVLQVANDALYIMGGKYENRFAIAAQLVQEKGWDWWDSPEAPYNVGNVTNGGVEHGFAEYQSLTAGMEGFAHVYTSTSFDGGKTLVYQNVLDAAKNGTNEDLLHAICNSPFCAPPYPYDELHSIMVQIQQLHDAEVAAHTPVAKPEPSTGKYVTVTKFPPHNTYWGIAQDVYGAGAQWGRLLPLNPGVNPNALQIGQQIRYE